MEIGIKTTDELKKLVQDYQSGNAAQQQVASVTDINSKSASPTYYGIAKRDVSGGVGSTYTREALSEGFGTKRYDKEYLPGEDLEDRRALEQSNFSKITNYLGKGAVTAATTFANGTAGLVAGLIAGAVEGVADPGDDGRKVIDAMVNNPFSVYMENLRDWSDKALPTYLSAEQRSDEYQKEWYKHMFTTDFAGEFIQNFGFTIGAMFSGAAWSKALTALKGKSFANDILKSAIVASEGDATATEELKNAYNALQKGNLTRIDANKLTQNVKNVAKRINRANTDVQLFGATVGAMAEGDMEGIMARKEMIDDFNRSLSEEHDEKYTNALNDVLNSNNGAWVMDSSEFDPETGGFKPMLTPEGKAEVLKRQQAITANEQKQIEIANREGDRIASITFALNLPILTTSNMIQFGRMLSGGWKTSRKLLGVQGGKVITRDAINAAYKAKGSVPVKTVFKSLENILSEGSEEMLQGFVSSGNKKYAAEKIASFNNAAYDEDSINSVRYWMENFGSGGLEYLKDPKNWKEGALGGLTGLFGIPGRKWHGGILGARAEAKEEVDASKRSAQELNNLVNSPEFRARWNGYIRHLKYDDDIAKALEKDDEYAFHTADEAQLISDVVMFADADRLDDLIGIAESFKQVTKDDIENLKGELDWTKDLSNDQIIQKIWDQADKMITTVNEYRDMYEALSSRAPIGASREFLQELTVTAQNIKAFERRFDVMLNEVVNTTFPGVLKLTNKESISEEPENIKRQLEELRSSFAEIVSYFPCKYIPNEAVEQIDNVLSKTLQLVKLDDALSEKVTDMRKAIADRQSFYRKLQILQGDAKNTETGKQITQDDAQKAFNAAAMTPEKVEDAAAKEHSRQETEGLETVAQIREKYNSKTSDSDKKEFLKDLARVSKSNPAAREYLNIREEVLKFQKYLSRTVFNPDENPYYASAGSWLVSQMLDAADSVDDVHNLEDSMFAPYEIFSKEKSNVLYRPSIDDYNRIKDTIRKAMQQFLKDSADTRAEVSEKSVSDDKPGKSTESGGYDAPVSASTTDSPTADESKEKPESKEPKKVTIIDPDRDEPVQAEIEQMALSSQKDDNVFVAQDIEGASQEEDGEDKTVYYRTSIPEIDSSEASSARNAIQNKDVNRYKMADLSDFVDKHPEYYELWYELKNRGAFDYVATQLKAGDTIEFIIDPTFPKYKGEPVILMAKKVDDKYQILSPLGRDTDTTSYYGIDNARKRILEEYDKFSESHQDEIFSFSQTSKVFMIKPGLIEYKWDKDSEKPIQDIPSYSEDAPIVGIIRNPETNKLEVTGIRGGEAAKELADKVIKPDAKNRYGIYYMVKSNAPSLEAIPVRINPIRYTRDNYTHDNPIFKEIDDSIRKIAHVVSEADTDNYKEKDVDMRKELSNLSHLLDIHTAYFTLVNVDKKGVMIKIAPEAFRNNKSSEKEKSYWHELQYSDESQIYRFLINQITKMNRHIQIDSTTTPERLKTMIDNNLLTSNAQRLRMKGVDFYCEPWIDEAGKFDKIFTHDMSDAAKEEMAGESSEINKQFDSGMDAWVDDESAPEPTADTKPSGDDKFDNPEMWDVKSQEDVNEVLDRKGVLALDKMIKLDFSELDDDTRKKLEAEDYDEETYDSLSEELKKRALVCIGVE